MKKLKKLKFDFWKNFAKDMPCDTCIVQPACNESCDNHRSWINRGVKTYTRFYIFMTVLLCSGIFIGFVFEAFGRSMIWLMILSQISLFIMVATFPSIVTYRKYLNKRNKNIKYHDWDLYMP
jgi:hypothetical protein